jgi:hypothetical protein
VNKCRCGKRAYRDEIAAKLVLAGIGKRHTRRPKDESRAYRCVFGRWHLTSQERRTVPTWEAAKS